jgi:hypothetical protein
MRTDTNCGYLVDRRRRVRIASAVDEPGLRLDADAEIADRQVIRSAQLGCDAKVRPPDGGNVSVIHQRRRWITDGPQFFFTR